MGAITVHCVHTRREEGGERGRSRALFWSRAPSAATFTSAYAEIATALHQGRGARGGDSQRRFTLDLNDKGLATNGLIK